MDVKILQDSRIQCLLEGTNYDSVYLSLQEQLKGREFIFAERVPGAGFLQWNLPGDDWCSFSKADPIMLQTLHSEKERLFATARAVFGGNSTLAARVMTIPQPNDDYLYYRIDANGEIHIMLVAWGYKYPDVVTFGKTDVVVAPTIPTEKVSICFEYDKKRVPNYEFKIVLKEGKVPRQTGDDGQLELGNLPIGSTYSIEDATGQVSTFTITAGQNLITVDVTKYSDVKVVVRSKRDKSPVQGAKCDLKYNGKANQLITDEKGEAVERCVIDFSKSQCVVTVGAERQSKVLEGETTIFSFELPEPIQKVKPVVKVVDANGQPCPSYKVFIDVEGVAGEYVSDAQGVITFAQECNEGARMVVSDRDITKHSQSYVIALSQSVYTFALPPVAQPKADDCQIRVVVHNSDSHTVSNEPCTIIYGGQVSKVLTDTLGIATLKVDSKLIGENCLVEVRGVKQQKILNKGVTLFEFVLPATAPQGSISPRIKVMGDNGFVARSYPISVEIGGVATNYVSDRNGIVLLPEMPVGTSMIVSDRLIVSNVQQFVLKADQEEYIFKVPYVDALSDNNIKITVLDSKGNPMKDATAFVTQTGANDVLAYLDDGGSMYIDRKDYDINKPISLTLTIGDEKYEPILFEIEEDEDEYLLQMVLKPTIADRLLEALVAMLGGIVTLFIFFALISLI